jgi:hypothetical protein
LHQLAFPLAVYEDSFVPTTSPRPIVGGVFDDQATIFIQIPRVGNLEGVALLGKERGLREESMFLL